MKKVLIFIIILLASILTLTSVKAEGDKTLVIELPSNEMNYENYMLYLSYRQFIVSSLLLNDFEENILINQEGKSIIVKKGDFSNFSFSLLDNVTEEDCTIEITDEMRAEFIEELGIDILEGYSKIRFEVKEIQIEWKDKYYTIDLTKNDFIDLPIYCWLYAFITIGKDGRVENCYVFTNKQGKELMRSVEESEITDAGAIINDNLPTRIEVSDNLTEDDDLIVEVDNRIVNITKNIIPNLNSYNNLIIKFSDKEYETDGNYILDMKNINEEDYYKLLYLLVELELSDELKIEKQILIMNSEGKTMMSYGAGPYVLYGGLFYIKIGKDVTYEDNIIMDLNENFIEEFNIKADNVEKVVIKLANPIFLEGKEQTYNLKDKDMMSFRLNIPYDKFLEYGKVYIDDKLVDAKNYKVTEGSTIITLNKDYVTSLKKGEHNIRVEMIDGEVSTTFNIVDRVEIIEPIVEAVNKIIVENPETGDKIIICSILLVLSLVGVIVFRKKRRV